jgi:phosphate/sulfate permease
MFLGLTILLGLLGVVWVVAAILGAMLSFAFSMVFLSHLRDEMSRQIANKRQKSKDEQVEDDLEN